MVPEKALNTLRMIELSAIDAFAKGSATVKDWHAIKEMANLAETMAKAGVGPEALDACERTQTALIEAKERFDRIGKMGTTGPGLQAFRELYEYHDLQRQSVPRYEYERHIQTTANRIRSKAPDVISLTST